LLLQQPAGCYAAVRGKPFQQVLTVPEGAGRAEWRNGFSRLFSWNSLAGRSPSLKPEAANAEVSGEDQDKQASEKAWGRWYDGWW
jgi:hypothetical protein